MLGSSAHKVQTKSLTFVALNCDELVIKILPVINSTQNVSCLCSDRFISVMSKLSYFVEISINHIYNTLHTCSVQLMFSFLNFAIFLLLRLMFGDKQDSAAENKLFVVGVSDNC